MNVKNPRLVITAMLLLTDLVILLNIPLLRQIFGFPFLTLLPGLLILNILKLNKLDSTEKFVLSVGSSISFLMFFGLLINNLSHRLGYEAPLATIPLLISFNIAFVVLAIIGYNTNKYPVFSISNLNLSTSEKAFLIVPVLFPALSVFGMHVMNTTNNNIILMFLLILISAYVVCVCFFNQKFPKRFFPIVISFISISLLLLLALRSNHIIGIDTHKEYYLYQTTLDNLQWRAFAYGNALDACLAISVLPAIYQSILNIPSEFMFKILYPLLFSISPVIIYAISRNYTEDCYAFLSSFFFMSAQSFLWTSYHARTNTAILFFALATMVLFNNNIDLMKKRILFIVFVASCIVSHYSTTYIFFFIMLGTFIGVEILSTKNASKKIVSLAIVFLFFTMLFLWYSQVTETAFNAGLRFIENTFTNLNKFFVEEMRSDTTHALLGEGIMQKGIPHKIEFVLTWLTFAFIGIGIITVIRRYKEMSFPELNFKKADFLREKFEVGYFVVALACSGLLVAVIALPFVSKGYGMDRAYLLGITILSVFFVIGGIIGAKYLDRLLSKTKIVKNKREVQAYVIILLVLVPYFLSTTGVTYQMFGVPRAITLNSDGEQYDRMYVHDHESYNARWFKECADEKTRIYTDYTGGNYLISQGMVRSLIYDPSFIEDKEDYGNGYIFLRYVNVVDRKLLSRDGQWHNLAEYDHLFVERTKIYDNSGSEVWR